MTDGVVPSFDIVVPTVGRPQLAGLLRALDGQAGTRPHRVFVVDDRRAPSDALPVARWIDANGWLASRLRVVDGPAAAGMHGPAAARNRGWRHSQAEWIAFLDDDVEPEPDWLVMLGHDLAIAEAIPDVAGSSGRIHVPMPATRKPTDWERDVAGLERAYWATADMAYRRSALEAVHGFDEGFPDAYREDADLAARILDAGYQIVPGARRTAHPVRPARWSVSIDRQRGNASDARMRAKHGRGWRQHARTGRGRFGAHVCTTLAGSAALAGWLTGRPRIAAASAFAWAAMTADFAWKRIAPGPRTPAEIAAMVVTSACIPPAAIAHRLRGEVIERRRRRNAAPPLDVVLLDRDGTIVVDRPYNGNPAQVVPVPDARTALGRLRERGIALGVVTNQSGIARGLLTHDQVRAVNGRVEQILGPFGGWWYCPHDDGARCDCRKPAPGMLLRALRHFGVRPERCALVGDTAADIDAAHTAGMRAVLVPNHATRPEEVERAPLVASSLDDAVQMLLGGRA